VKVVVAREELLFGLGLDRPQTSSRGTRPAASAARPPVTFPSRLPSSKRPSPVMTMSRRLDARGEVDDLHDGVESPDERSAQGGEGTRYASGGAGALQGLDVDSLFVQVPRAKFREASVDESQIPFAHALLEGVASSTAESSGDVGGGDDRHWKSAVLAQELVASKTTVGGRRTAKAQQYRRGAESGGGEDQFADARARGGESLFAGGIR